jgi:hypothetical protein
MPVPLLDKHLLRQTLDRPDMKLEAVFRGVCTWDRTTADPESSAFGAFLAGAMLGRDFPLELDRLIRDFERRRYREVGAFG